MGVLMIRLCYLGSILGPPVLGNSHISASPITWPQGVHCALFFPKVSPSNESRSYRSPKKADNLTHLNSPEANSQYIVP